MKSRLPLVILGICVFGALTARADSGAAEKVFQRYDKNRDGRVTFEELPRAEIFKEYDLNQDGAITLPEFLEVLARKKNGAQASEGVGSKPLPPMVEGIHPSELGLGRQVADLELDLLEGTRTRLSKLSGPKGLVVAVSSCTCPVSKRYAPTLARLESELAAKGVRLLLLNVSTAVDAEAVAQFNREHGLALPCAHDRQRALAGALGARSTTEVFLLDQTRTLVYRGALDDQYGPDFSLEAPRTRFLSKALAAMLEGREVAPAATEAPGCELETGATAARPAGVDGGAAGGASGVTYYKDVARILQRHCVRCHHEGGIAPFALDDLAEVRDHAGVIRRVVERREMPPWFAAPVPEGGANPWANDCSLPARDAADLLGWLASADRPLGEVSDAPVPLSFAKDWKIGKPDLVLQLPRPIAVKASGVMPYQFAVVETEMPEDKWVAGYEIQPTVREVVHHVIVKVHPKGSDVRNKGGGDEDFWAAYVPGNDARLYPRGFAKRLPAGAKVTFEIHYTPSGKAVNEQLRMGLVFAPEAPQYEVHTIGLANRGIQIPPGAADHLEQYERRAPSDLHVGAFLAHMHVRGKAFKFELIGANGAPETLLDIPKYDFNWQLSYQLRQPRLIPRGSTVRISAKFDNSAANRANPDPTKLVKWGQQTTEEMMIGYLEHYVLMPASAR